MIENIEKYVNIPGISGFENKVKKMLKDDLLNQADEIYEDNLGGIAFKFSSGKPGKNILIAAHMDEVGFIIKRVNGNGIISVFPVGGFAIETVLSQRVIAYNKAGDSFEGVILGKSPHLITGNEQMTLLDLEVDFGFTSKDNFTESSLKIGDMVVFKNDFQKLSNDRYVSKAFDNRLGCSTLIEIADFLNNRDIFKGNIFLGATVQEEVGLRGASPLLHAINEEIDEVLVVDVSPVNDTKKNENGSLGAGVLLRVADPRSLLDYELLNTYRTLAQDNNIANQEYFSKGGTDAAMMQIVKTGYPTFALCVPARNVHSNNSIIDLNDYKALISLIKVYLGS